jgi:hypothetical protein
VSLKRGAIFAQPAKSGQNEGTKVHFTVRSN